MNDIISSIIALEERGWSTVDRRTDGRRREGLRTRGGYEVCPWYDALATYNKQQGTTPGVLRAGLQLSFSLVATSQRAASDFAIFNVGIVVQKGNFLS